MAVTFQGKHCISETNWMGFRVRNIYNVYDGKAFKKHI